MRRSIIKDTLSEKILTMDGATSSKLGFPLTTMNQTCASEGFYLEQLSKTYAQLISYQSPQGHKN
jgi:hypothetical protein